MQVKTESPALPLPKRIIQAEISAKDNVTNRADRNADSKGTKDRRWLRKSSFPKARRAERRGFQRLQHSANRGLARIQSVQQSVAAMRDLFLPMRELANAATSSTLETAARDDYQEQFEALRAELGELELERDTRFPGQGLLRMGDSEAFGGLASGRPSVQFPPHGDHSASVASKSGTLLAEGGFESAIGQLDSLTAVYGLVEERLADRILEAGAAWANGEAAASIPEDALVAHGMATLTRDQILALPENAWAAQTRISPRSALALLG